MHYIIMHGIEIPLKELSEPLDIKEWQRKIIEKPFNMKEAFEYLGVSTVTLRRWVKVGKVPAYKAGRAYTFDVVELRKFKRSGKFGKKP